MKRPPYLYVVVAALALLGSVWLFRDYLPYTRPPMLPKQPPAVLIAMDDVHLVGLGSKGKLWSVRARNVEISQNRTTTTLEHITQGRIYDRGRPILDMQAGRAVYDTFYRDLQLGGGVLIKGKNGQTVSGGGASWNSAGATMRSIGQVLYRSSWGTASVGEMAVDLRSRQVVMKRVNFKFELKGAM